MIVIPQPLKAEHGGTMQNRLNRQQAKDMSIVGRFTEVWCSGHHHSNRQTFLVPGSQQTLQLCPECTAFMEYVVKKRLICPLEAEKPSCKHCRIHCYAPQQRAQVKQIMAWSGRRMILRGRLDYLWHYLF
jgi:hypothetical protein